MSLTRRLTRWELAKKFPAAGAALGAARRFQPGPRDRARMELMATIPPGQPGHDDGTMHLRLQPVRIVNGIIEGGYTGQWEVICPACGDEDRLDYASVSPELQEVRGPYPSKDEGLTALERHKGLLTWRTRQNDAIGD